MKAVVVGAGIAGLVTARQLGLAGWEVEVLEKSPAPRPDGYMMDFFGPGVEASERIGLYPRLARAAYRVQAAQYVDMAGRVTASLDYSRFSELAGGKVLSLMRPDLELAAFEALDDVPSGRVGIHYGASCVQVSGGDDGVRITVEQSENRRGIILDSGDTAPTDTDTINADVLIGADGIHSAVRAAVFGPEPDFLRPLGMRAAAFIVTEPMLNARFRDRFILTDSIDRTVGFYGLRQDQMAAFLVYREPPPLPAVEATREVLRREFAGLGDVVDRLLVLCPEQPYDDVVAQIIMERWHLGRIVLVGDACGAVSLLAGQGGSLAVAGAALLGEVLGKVDSLAGIGAALAEFEQRWRPVVQTAQRSGRRAAASFLPANRTRRLLRRWIIRATRLPGIDRWVARMIVSRIAK